MDLRVESITKLYPAESGHAGPAALTDVSLSAADGEVISLVGPSGSGKSTLLRTIAGLELPDRGRVRYGGHDVTDVRPQDRGIGMVFQDYALYPSKPGKGNLSYFFEVHRRSEDEAETRAREVAQVMGVGFDVLLGRMPGNLSGGEQQRLAIARCIVRDPTLFLMDEPICNLDAKLRESTRVELKKLLRRFGITTVYVTHDQSEALFMGDRIAVLRAGRIEQLGTFDELYYAPVNAFVAQFIGSPPMSLLRARISDRTLIIKGVRWPLPEALAATPGGEWLIGVRPEGWTLGDGLSLLVRRVEQVATERAAYVHGSVDGTDVSVLIDPARLRSAGDPGTTLMIRPDLDQVCLFDSDQVAVASPGVPDFF